MNRSDLIKRMKNQFGLPQNEADWLVRQFFDVLADGLDTDNRVELRGFGVFRCATRHQAGFHNPKDGRFYEGMTIRTVKFYPSTADSND